jgi:hypothetical protein
MTKMTKKEKEQWLSFLIATGADVEILPHTNYREYDD